jgi:hypothetical protein
MVCRQVVCLWISSLGRAEPRESIGAPPLNVPENGLELSKSGLRAATSEQSFGAWPMPGRSLPFVLAVQRGGAQGGQRSARTDPSSPPSLSGY